MSSSTSSSEPVGTAAEVAQRPGRHHVVRPLAIVVVLLIALEALTRLFLVPASRDLEHCAGYPARARALFAQPGAGLVIVGNSALREGVDPDALARALGVPVGLFAADSAKVTTMYWLVQHDLWAQGLRPPVVVVPYFGNQLADGEELDIGRLARYLSGPRDWPELFRTDLPRLDQRAELIVSSMSAAFAARRRVKERVLGLLPHYKDTINLANRVLFDHDHAAGGARPSYATLRRFVARARAQGTRLWFVAMPTQDETDIPSEARLIVEQAGMSILDLRHVGGLGPQHYLDAVHLNEAGRRVFTRVLAQAVAEQRAVGASQVGPRRGAR